MSVERQSEIQAWISGISDELEIDAVGLWQIVRTLRDKFKVSDDELSGLVRKSIAELLASGARPVGGSKDAVAKWAFRTDLGVENDQITERVISDWLASGRDPGVGDVWFATPRLVGSVQS